MDYGEVLSKAATIVWKFKVLWIFGILASCGQGGNSSSSNYSGNSGNFNSSGANLPPELMRLALKLREFGTWIENNLWIIAVLIALLCVIWIAVIFLSTMGRIGLVKGTFKADQGAESMSFGELWGESLPYFWRSLGLALIIGLPVLIIVFSLIAVVTAGAIFTSSAGGGSEAAVGGSILLMLSFFCLCMCILVPFLWVLGILTNQAQAAMVVENLGIIEALERGWSVIRKNVGPMVIMFIIMLVIGIAAAIIMLLVSLPFVLPLFVPLFGWLLNNGKLNMTLLYIGLACFAVFIPISMVMQGILTAYSEAVWTLTYLRLARRAQPIPGDVLDIPDSPSRPPSDAETPANFVDG